MRTPLLLVAALAGACGASSAEIKSARDASYASDRHQVWQSVLDAVAAEYKIDAADEQQGVIYTAWKTVERTAEGSNDRNIATKGALMFRAKIIVRGGPPWATYVDGVAGEFRPAMSVITEFKHGDEGEPGWVEGRIDSLYLAIHDRLKANAVYGSKPPPPAEAAVDRGVNADMSNTPGSEANRASTPPVGR